uniref:Uncharacterized protein n=1 Tax=Rhizophora mucronata TaxID=61149 RepID=A0A2P2MQM2_RHIMU
MLHLIFFFVFFSKFFKGHGALLNLKFDHANVLS